MEAVVKLPEVQTLFKARSTVKGSVTRVTNKLKESLTLETGGKYDFTSLNKKAIQDNYEKLKGNIQALEKAHEAFVSKCLDASKAAGVSEQIVQVFEEEQEQDLDNNKNNAFDAIGLYEFEYKAALDQYLHSIQEQNKVSSAGSQDIDSQSMKKKAKAGIKKMLNRWTVMVEEWDILVKNSKKTTEKTADLTAEQLGKEVILLNAEKELSSLETEWKQLYEFYLQLGDELDQADYGEKAASEAINFNLSEQIKLKGEVIGELKRIVESQKFKAVESKVVTPVESRNGLKLKGLTAPQFSGKAEDFASWKERFLALVPKGRSNEEVAALLELSIPSKKVYLLRGCQQDDYEGMLDILQKELAPTRDIINNVKLQLTKMKKISADDKEGDRKFINMVEELEKISRDLKAVNDISVLAILAH